MEHPAFLFSVLPERLHRALITGCFRFLEFDPKPWPSGQIEPVSVRQRKELYPPLISFAATLPLNGRAKSCRRQRHGFCLPVSSVRCISR